jgi:asparagine synthase (glutamine-hydrolysing)
MCGIFGAAFLRPGSAVQVDAALRSLAHRGPDDSGSMRGDDFVLGHTRLAILDLSPAGRQPMTSADGDVLVVFNGEIYNHHALRRELSARGHVFRSRSDTEVIVEGYRAFGDHVIERLDGMFALAILDQRARRLLLARDRVGKKPLFYCLRDGELRFASEVKAIVASGAERVVDVESLPFLLAFGYPPPDRSMVRDVRQLPPAHVLAIGRPGTPVIRRYWCAPFAAPPLPASDADLIGEVRRLVERAVEKRLEADVPLGAFLSGGVDSTIVVGVMARALGRPVRTFSLGFAGDARFDETRYARVAARAFGTDHTELTLEPSAFDLVERLVQAHDGPFGDSSAIPTAVVSMLTRRHVTVALTGDGGDELFCGYPRFLAAEAAEHIPEPARALGRLLWRGRIAPSGSTRVLDRLTRFASVAALPLAERLAAWCSYFLFDLDRILRPETAARVSCEGPLAWCRAIVAATAGSTPLSRILRHNFETYLPHDLLVKADRSSMMHGLELRSPFLDTELIELASRLPDRLRRRGRETKRALKRAFADLLPPEIAARAKMGFGMPLGQWFAGDLRDYLRDRFCRGAAIFDWLDERYVRALLNEHFTRRADHGHKIWLLLTLQTWLQGAA